MQKLFVCISFYFDPRKKERLKYLKKILNTLPSLSKTVHLCITTNILTPDFLKFVEKNTHGYEKYTFDFHKELPHPHLYTWMHKPLLKDAFESEESFSNFLYMEDDMLITKQNIEYWETEREKLKPYNLYPALFRTEWSNPLKTWMSADMNKDFHTYGPIAKLLPIEDLIYTNTRACYQAVTLYDRALLAEHLASPHFNLVAPSKMVTPYDRLLLKKSTCPIFDPKYRTAPYDWDLRTQATAGPMFCNVPTGFKNRNVLPFDKITGALDPRCFIHHLPDTYANMPGSPMGKVRLSDIHL